MLAASHRRDSLGANFCATTRQAGCETPPRYFAAGLKICAHLFKAAIAIRQIKHLLASWSTHRDNCFTTTVARE
jgi:hypothetical protein